MEREVLDSPSEEFYHFEKSKKLLFFSMLFLISLIIIIIVIPYFSESEVDFIIIPGILLIAATTISNGLGIVAGFKSYYYNEKYKRYRIWILLSHILLFCFYLYLIFEATYRTITLG